MLQTNCLTSKCQKLQPSAPMKRLFHVLSGVLLLSAPATAGIYSGNGGTGFGGALGNSSLTVTDQQGGGITFALNAASSINPGMGDTNIVVFYINSVSGGFADTSTFSDNLDGGRTAISGFNAGNNSGNGSRTLATFASGFTADFAIAIDARNNFAGLFGLASGGNNSLTFIRSANLIINANTYTLSFNAVDVGLVPSAGQSFSFVASLISNTAYRSNETIGTSTTVQGSTGANGNAGFDGTTTFSNFDTYVLTAVPEPGPVALLGVGVIALVVSVRRRIRWSA